MSAHRAFRLFPKSEKLTGKKNIEELFTQGSSIFLFPYLLKYRAVSEGSHRFLVAVPKKKFKRATDRNRIKRQIREAYRLNKYRLYEQHKAFYHVAFIYQSEDMLSFSELNEKLIRLLDKFQKQAL